MVVHFTSRRALRRLVWAPNELGFARAYVSGDVQIEGDLLEALTRLDALADPERGPGVRVGPGTTTAIAKAVLRLAALGPPPQPPAEEIRLSGGQHTPGRDAKAVSHHYDVGNDFYALVLGPSMLYSCAYFEQEPSPSYTLEDAQHAKLDLVARKLGLVEGMRLLDVGCGWGSFVIHAAREYGTTAVGVTLSQEQASFARAAVASAGLADRVEIRVQDYRDVADGPYDAIASVGMAEHVGLSQLGEYCAHLHDLLAPGGRLLNHAISRRPGPAADPQGDKTSFIDRYVFPDGELHPLSTMVDALESAGFEVRDGSLREHYATPCARGWPTSNRTGATLSGSPVEVGPGCGGSTWPGRHLPSGPTASASTRCSRSSPAPVGAAVCLAREGPSRHCLTDRSAAGAWRWRHGHLQGSLARTDELDRSAGVD